MSTPDPPDRSSTDPGDPRWRLSPTKIVVAIILLIGIVTPLLVGTYASAEPRLWGFPFFYWYQLLWVFIAAALCGLAFVLLRRERLRFERDQAGRSTSPKGGDAR